MIEIVGRGVGWDKEESWVSREMKNSKIKNEKLQERRLGSFILKNT